MKFQKMALLAAFLGFVFSGCTLYEDGPLFSVLPKKDRIDNVWKADQVTRADGTDITDDYDNWTWTFTKDGDATVEYEDFFGTVTLNGEWNLIDNDEVFQLILQVIGEDISNYDILRLTDNEFWLLDEDGNEFHLETK